MNRRTYKGILFDLDNTLLDYDRSELEAMRRSLAQHGMDPDDIGFWEPFWHHFSRSNETYWLERFERNLHINDVLKLSFRDTFDALRHQADPGLLGASYWQHFSNLFLPEDGAEDSVRRLHGVYKLAIVSNGIGEAQHQRLQAGDLRHLFDVVVVSDETGVAKPDPGIFKVALERLDLKRGDVLFIGDSLRDDYAGALAAGIDFCFYNRKKKPVPAGVIPTYMIEHLRELEHLLP